MMQPYDPTTAEQMIAAAFGMSEGTLRPDPDFTRLLELQGSAPFRYACDQMAPLVPRLTVPEVLGLAVQLIGHVALTEVEYREETTPACQRAVSLFTELQAEGFSARDMANITATILAGLVLMFPA